ncbi:hypothetical protein XENOCAPTIV_028109 [Xenoophorus captivus]|uniref:Uncharacterized protein n=1 Tax=Xenoophorus captivus TaxID=1517983 RepID=A0ABV0QV03_9TELE
MHIRADICLIFSILPAEFLKVKKNCKTKDYLKKENREKHFQVKTKDQKFIKQAAKVNMQQLRSTFLGSSVVSKSAILLNQLRGTFFVILGQKIGNISAEIALKCLIIQKANEMRGDGIRDSSCNRLVAGANPRSVRLSCCVLEQDTTPAQPPDGGQRAQWCQLYGSLAFVSQLWLQCSKCVNVCMDVWRTDGRVKRYTTAGHLP